MSPLTAAPLRGKPLGFPLDAAASTIAPGAPTILLVENNPITRGMLRAALEVDGHDVVEAATGRMALETAGLRRPGLVVLDFVLPDMDGLQLLGEMRLQAPDLPAIVVTGMVARHGERLAGSSATHFLAKPVQVSRLLDVVRAQLASAEEPVGGRRILVVGDALHGKLSAVWLKRAGYEVVTAEGGAEALAMARLRPPDAILCDVLMPSMDGFSLCRAVRREAALAAIPVVLVSSFHVNEADGDLARRVGANALVMRTPDLALARVAIEESLLPATGAPVALGDEDGDAASLHRERLEAQLERQRAWNEALLRQGSIQSTALSLLTGLSEVLARPHDVRQRLGEVLVHCLDAAGLSTGLLYTAEPGGDHRLQAQFGIPADRKSDAEKAFGHPELVRRVVEVGQPAAFCAVGADQATRDFLGRLGHTSALVTPLAVLGEPFGALVLGSDAHDLCQTAWTAFARSLAQQFGQTLALGQSMKRLAASEARHSALMENANDAIFVLDTEGTVLEANQHAATLLGTPRDELVGKHISSFSPAPGPEADAIAARFQAQLAAGGGRADNVRLRRGDGVVVEVDFAMSLSMVDGQPSVLSIGREVTERNRTSRALRDAQQRLAHVVSSSPAVLYSMRLGDGAPVLTWASDNVLGLTGSTAAEALAPGWWTERIHPDDRERVASGASVRTGGAGAREYRFRHADGTYRWIQDEQALIVDTEGRSEIVGSWSDATARKNAEQRLQRSEEQYRLLFDGNPHPMYVCDASSLAFLAVNDAMLRHYGYSREELLALSAWDIRAADGVAALEKSVAAIAAGREPAQGFGVFQHRKKDGSPIEMEISASLLDFQGRSAWLVLAVDVTRKKGLEDQLVRSQKMEAVGQLAGGIAHDFNNLLGVVIGYGELLLRDLPEESRSRKRVEEILHASDRAAGLTRQLLAFGRRQVLQPTVLDLNDVLAGVANMLGRLISEDIQIVANPQTGLGRVRADAGQVEQVLMNLVINARDAMPAGGSLVIETQNVELDAVYVRTHPDARPGRYVMLSVSDTGHGMDAATMSRIFEPFFTTKEEGKGTGLGLATVYGIVRQSGGTMDVYSEPGHGAVFRVYLPRVDDEVARDAAAEPAAPPRGTGTVLVVEDSESLRLLVRELLEEAGYTVLDAEAPDAALELLQSATAPIDVVLTDMVMPRMGGRELASRVAHVHPGARVVFMSGYAEDAAGRDATLEPGSLFLQKPFTLDALLRMVRRAIEAPAPATEPHTT